MKRGAFFTMLVLNLLLSAATGQDNSVSAKAPDADTVCTFADGQQISIRYPEVPSDRSDLPSGKVWRPDNRPMYLFSQTTLSFGPASIPPGAYSLYPVPGDKSWTLVLNKGVQQGASYDSKQDIAKLDAQTAQLPSPAKKLTLYFGRIKPTTCTLRIDYGKQRAYADFNEKK
jgi:hypothetical protein